MDYLFITICIGLCVGLVAFAYFISRKKFKKFEQAYNDTNTFTVIKTPVKQYNPLLNSAVSGIKQGASKPSSNSFTDSHGSSTLYSNSSLTDNLALFPLINVNDDNLITNSFHGHGGSFGGAGATESIPEVHTHVETSHHSCAAAHSCSTSHSCSSASSCSSSSSCSSGSSCSSSSD